MELQEKVPAEQAEFNYRCRVLTELDFERNWEPSVIFED